MRHFSNDKTYALFLNPANRKIISELEVIGAKTILFPTLETREISNSQAADLPKILSDFDWLVFTDIYTVEFFLQKLQELDFDFFELDEMRVCAFGESVADRLRFAQLHADIIPNKIKTAEILQAIKDYFINAQELKEARFLVLKEKKSIIEISNELKNLGATISELSIYETVTVDESETTKLKSLLVGGAVDEFIFTSPLDAVNLAHLFPTDNLIDVLKDTKLYAADNVTAQSLSEFRLH